MVALGGNFSRYLRIKLRIGSPPATFDSRVIVHKVCMHCGKL